MISKLKRREEEGVIEVEEGKEERSCKGRREGTRDAGNSKDEGRNSHYLIGQKRCWRIENHRKSKRRIQEK
jgi:hypothetical protein